MPNHTGPDRGRGARISRERWCAFLVGTALLASATNPAAAAGDVKAGRVKAQLCQACHGVDGLSKVPDAPNLAGQIEGYLVTQLNAFRSGARKNESMTVVASTLSDSDIANLAAYFAAIDVKIGNLPGD